MFVFKIAEPAAYYSKATDAEFKFKQSSKKERDNLAVYATSVLKHENQESLWTDYCLNEKYYYAAWLLEDFSNVQQDGKAHDIKKFDLQQKAELIQALKQADPEFSHWFATHCEPAEKKAAENAATEELVEPGSLQGVQ